MASLRPALANVQNAIANLNVARWKAPAETRAAVQQDIASMQRDLNATLPGLVTQAEARRSGARFPRLLPFSATSMPCTTCCCGSRKRPHLPAPASDAGSLEDARAGLEDGRAKLGAWLLQSIGAQDAQIVRLQAAAASRPAAAPPPPPNKIVVDDGPENPKPHKKKPPPPRHHSNLFCGTTCPSGGV